MYPTYIVTYCFHSHPIKISMNELLTSFHYFIFYNFGQNIWNKIEKSSITRKEKNGLISIFVCFLTTIAKV